MKIINSVLDFYSEKPTIVTIGTFDGVHIGHQQIIKELVIQAEKNNLIPCVFTFFPFPKMILTPLDYPKQIQTLQEKLNTLKQFGIQLVVVQPFSKEFADLEAEEFVREILHKRLHCKKIIVGYDHRFGKGRSATIDDLKIFGNQFSFEVQEISPQQINEISVSSTKVRKALLNGDLQIVKNYLGRYFSFTSKVIHGAKLGRKIGFPTANLEVSPEYKILPKQGAYVVKSKIDEKEYFGILNIGQKPTLNGENTTIEVHFFNFEGDLYSKEISVDFLHFIREEKKFSNIEELKNQLKKDENFAKEIIKNHFST